MCDDNLLDGTEFFEDMLGFSEASLAYWQHVLETYIHENPCLSPAEAWENIKKSNCLNSI